MTAAARSIAAEGPAARPTKIVFFVPGLNVGGAERHTADLCEAMRRQGFDCRIIVHGAKRSEVVTAMPGAQDAIFLDLRGMSELSGWGKIWRLLRALRPDIVVAVNQTPLVVAALQRFVLPRSYKLVCIFHTVEMQSYERRQEWLLRAAARVADLFVYVVATQRTIWEQRHLRPREATVIANGVDLRRFKQTSGLAGTPFARSPDELLLGMVAAFRPEKNHLALLDAMAAARARNVDVRAVLVGDGTTRPAVAARASDLGLAGRIVFAGEQADVAPFLHMCDVGLLCSTAETFPLSLIEFLASGVPVIAPRIGGIPDIVTDGRNGLLYEPGDIDGFARAIARMADPARRRALAAEAETSVAHLGVERMNAAYADAFRRLVAAS